MKVRDAEKERLHREHDELSFYYYYSQLLLNPRACMLLLNFDLHGGIVTVAFCLGGAGFPTR